MAYFEWASDMVIDHDGPIDQDHRRLVAQVNRLHDATSQGSGQEIVAGLLEELLADTKEHLAHEERFMASVGFPESEAHRKGHDHSLCGRAGALKRAVRRRQPHRGHPPVATAARLVVAAHSPQRQRSALVSGQAKAPEGSKKILMPWA